MVQWFSKSLLTESIRWRECGRWRFVVQVTEEEAKKKTVHFLASRCLLAPKWDSVRSKIWFIVVDDLTNTHVFFFCAAAAAASTSSACSPASPTCLPCDRDSIQCLQSYDVQNIRTSKQTGHFMGFWMDRIENPTRSRVVNIIVDMEKSLACRTEKNSFVVE